MLCTHQIPRRTGTLFYLRLPPQTHYRHCLPLISQTLPGGLRDNRGERDTRRREGGSSRDLRCVTTMLVISFVAQMYNHGIFDYKKKFQCLTY